MSNAQTVWQFTICVCTVGMAVSCLIEEKETMYVQNPHIYHRCAFEKKEEENGSKTHYWVVRVRL